MVEKQPQEACVDAENKINLENSNKVHANLGEKMDLEQPFKIPIRVEEKVVQEQFLEVDA